MRDHHGDRFVDPYAWLADSENPEVIAHLEAENAYAQAHLDAGREVATAIFDEIRAHVQETDVSVPVHMGDWWYFSRTTKGSQYPVHCRVPARAGDARPAPVAGVALEGEQVLLDVNREAQGQEFYRLGGLAVSHDGTRMAILYDVRGDERFALQVRDLSASTVLDEQVTEAGYGLVWSRSGEELFYTRVDDAWRQHQVWRHRIGSPQTDDELVLQEDDELFTVGIDESGDQQWMVIHAESSTTGEARIVPLADPGAEPRLIHPRESGLDYSIDVDTDQVLVVHNGSRVDFEVAAAPLDDPGRERWASVLSTAEGERVLGVQAFKEFAAVAMRSNGLPTVRILPKGAEGFGEPRATGLDGETRVVGLGDTPEYDSSTVQLTLESYLTPHSVYDLDVRASDLTLLWQRQVPGFDPDRYVEERVWVPVDDGVRVPLSVVRPRDVRADGRNPGYLYGYGSYEISSDPSFSARRLSLLDRGVVCAVAHVRGGGELGRAWYDDGKILAKKHTFTDFVACGRYLVDEGWVAPDRLSAEGGSAGGLLIGAVINLDPSLFRAVHAAVPFVDALTTILDPSMPLTVGEWEEWGNPLESAEVYHYMKSYSPYENISAAEYPAILATTSLNDTRVMCAEPAKWVQMLRDTVSNDPAERPILLRIEMVAGHGGRSGRYDKWRQVAEETAFLLDRIGATAPVVSG